MLPPAAIALAEVQHGVLARYQVVGLMGEAAADNALRSPACEPLDPPIRGVHRLRGGAPLAEQVAFGAALRSRPGATITGPLVLGLLGVGDLGTDAPFEILIDESRHLTNVPFPFRVDPDPDRPVVRFGEVRAAAPVDALIDSGAFVEAIGERTLRVAWDQLRWQGMVRQSRLLTRMDHLRGACPGVPVVDRVLEVGGGAAPESEGERRLGEVLRSFDPEPEPQVWVTPGRRTDWFFRRLRLGFEYLGRVDHNSTSARIRDDARDRELREEGIRLHYVSVEDLHEPQSLLATVAGLLTVRAHELSVTPPVAVRPLPT